MLFPATLTNGKNLPQNAPAKRWNPSLRELYLDDGNSTTKVTELDEHDLAELFEWMTEDAAVHAADKESLLSGATITSFEES